MQTITQAVILAGGEGMRLRPLTETTPKPLIRFHSKPFVQYLVDQLKANGIKRVVFLVGYLGEQIEDYFGNGEKFGIEISYSYTPVGFDTGSRIRNARDLFDDTFLLLYSDNYWPLDLNKLISSFEKAATKALVTVYQNTDNYTKNNMRVNEKGFVEVYDKTQTVNKLNGVDIGFFILKKEILKNLPRDDFSFEKIVLPRLIKKKQLAGFLTKHKYYGLSNLKRIPLIKKYFKPRNIILLDRDGVVNRKAKEADYIKSVNEFTLLPGAIEGLKLLVKSKFEIYIISNQAGIGRGLMSQHELNDIHKVMLKTFADNNIKIKAIYICPHKWDEGCECRKPKPGMLFQAAADYHFDLTKAVFIGDDKRDAVAGKTAWCKTILMKPNGSLLETLKKSKDLFS